MRKLWKTIQTQAVLLAALLILMLSPVSLFAGEAKTYTKPVIEDKASLMTDQEKESLMAELDQLAKKSGWTLFVLTTNDAEGKTEVEYADDYVDTHAFEKDGVCYLIDMDNRKVNISTTGIASRYLTDSRIESVIDSGDSDVKNGNYAEAFRGMIQKTSQYYDDGIPSGQYTKKPRGITPLEGVIAVAGAFLVAVIFAVSVNKKYRLKGTVYRYDYTGNSNMQLTRQEDFLVNQYVTSRQIPRNEGSSGGGSSTHRSSGGGTHGGGGRSF